MFMSLSYLKWWIYNTSHRWGMLIDLRFLLTSQYMWLQFHVWSSYLLAPSMHVGMGCVGTFLGRQSLKRTGGGALWSGADGPRRRAGRSATWREAAVLSGQAWTVRGTQGRTVRDLVQELGFPAWRPDGPRPRAGRSATWRQGRLPPPCWNLDLVPWGEKILRCSGSTGHPGCPKTTWSRLGIKRSIRGRCLGWTTRSCPPGGVRS
jgi:hypothetical protein